MNDLTNYTPDDTEQAFIHGMVERINAEFPHMEATQVGEPFNQRYHLDDKRGHTLNPPELEIYQRNDNRGWTQRLGSVSVHNGEAHLSLIKDPHEMSSTKLDIPGIGPILCMFGRDHMHKESYAIGDPSCIDNIMASLAKIASSEASTLPISKCAVWTIGQPDSDGAGSDSK